MYILLVCVCIWMYMYVYVCICTYVRMYVRMYVRRYVRMYVYWCMSTYIYCIVCTFHLCAFDRHSASENVGSNSFFSRTKFTQFVLYWLTEESLEWGKVRRKHSYNVIIETHSLQNVLVLRGSNYFILFQLQLRTCQQSDFILRWQDSRFTFQRF